MTDPTACREAFEKWMQDEGEAYFGRPDFRIGEAVDVSEEMVDRACMANLNPLAEPSETERKHMRASLQAALNIKEQGQ